MRGKVVACYFSLLLMMLFLGANALHANAIQYVTISDLGEGLPAWTAGSYTGSGLFILSATSAPEYLQLYGDIIDLSVAPGNGGPDPTAAGLREYAGGPISDFVVFNAQPTDCSGAPFTGHCDQYFTLTFESDGATNFASDLAGLGSIPTVVEIGGYRELDRLLDTYQPVIPGYKGCPACDNFSIQVQSDVPEPNTLFLLGSGLLVLGGSLKRRLFS